MVVDIEFGKHCLNFIILSSAMVQKITASNCVFTFLLNTKVKGEEYQKILGVH